ncbi:hypothetical protein GCM10009868_18040 [Terrabacter aerolatus]|uniref:Uncharacterized protein n=1 Tax=Terrabacter aerolatus TaxID=422442 RepID=A0A512CZN8_9MICO|nr:hypothetical protein TAE01_14850 [Terrabacter aerolatus]
MRRRIGDAPLAVAATIGFLAYVWALTRSAEPIVTVLDFASDGQPQLYAALLAGLIGLPGLLFVLPRALAPAPATIRAQARSRRQLAERRRTHLRTDLLGVAMLLLAQVPLPAPWSPAGKAATIANVTKSPEIIDLNALLAGWSVPVFVLGIGAATLAKVYAHAAGLRVIAITLAVGAPVLAWFVVVRAIA